MSTRRQIAVVLASAIALTGCSVLGSEQEAVAPERPSSSAPAPANSSAAASTSAPSASAAPVDLSRYYEQQVEWTSCAEAECATITVPLDYADPEGRTVSLAATRVPATGDRVGSLFVNPGGPGGSAVDYARAAKFVVSEKVRKHFDVVGVDPRGVGSSDPVTCLTDDLQDQLMAADGTPDSPEEEQSIAEESTIVLEGCQAQSGPIWDRMGTVDAARDMDIARAVVGDETFNFLGKSYGTMLGATYAELFPDHVGRMVLDGVLPANLDNAEITKGQADAFEVAVRDFARDCMTHDGCPLSGTVDEAVAQLQAWLVGLDENPIPAGDRDLNEALATFAVLSYLYFPQYDYPDLRSALAAAMNRRDPEALLSLLDSRTSRSPDGHFTDNSSDAFYAVTCSDRPYAGTVADVKALAAEWAVTAPTFGPALAWGLLPCKDWPSSGEAVTETVAAGSNPILVVSTTHDPATPYQWGEMVAETLDNAELLTWDSHNHTAYLEGSSCIESAVDAYILRGTLPPEGTVCS